MKPGRIPTLRWYPSITLRRRHEKSSKRHVENVLGRTRAICAHRPKALHARGRAHASAAGFIFGRALPGPSRASRGSRTVNGRHVLSPGQKGRVRPAAGPVDRVRVRYLPPSPPRHGLPSRGPDGAHSQNQPSHGMKVGAVENNRGDTQARRQSSSATKDAGRQTQRGHEETEVGRRSEQNPKPRVTAISMR